VLTILKIMLIAFVVGCSSKAQVDWAPIVVNRGKDKKIMPTKKQLYRGLCEFSKFTESVESA
jgi:hypothetical protein